MATPDHHKQPCGAQNMLSLLPESICQEIAQMASPAGPIYLTKDRLHEVRTTLKTTCVHLNVQMAQARGAESQDIMHMLSAFKAAIIVIDLHHKPN